MTAAFHYLCDNAPVLRRYGGDVERMARAFGVASGGEQVMIRAALSLVPESWLAPESKEIEPFRLNEIGRLDSSNAEALIQAMVAAHRS